MKKLMLLIVFCVFPMLSFNDSHKFYVSVTQIEYNKENESLEIVSRIFIDDIEVLLRERYDESIELNIKNESKQIDEKLDLYLKTKLQILVNGEERNFNFIGKEYEEDLMICYLEITNIKTLDKIEVNSAVLMDIFEEQQNIVHVKKGKQRKSLILEKEKENGVLNFSE